MSAKRGRKKKGSAGAAKKPRSSDAEQLTGEAAVGVQSVAGDDKARSTGSARATKPARRVGAPDERPPAPWGSFPLAELTILGGIICLAIGFFGGQTKLLGVGVALAGLGGMEVAIREHFAGYRSHSTLLAGTVFVFTVGGLFYLANQILAVALAVGAVAFLVAFLLARRAFQRASGGLSFRVGGLRG